MRAARGFGVVVVLLAVAVGLIHAHRRAGPQSYADEPCPALSRAHVLVTADVSVHEGAYSIRESEQISLSSTDRAVAVVLAHPGSAAAATRLACLLAVGSTSRPEVRVNGRTATISAHTDQPTTGDFRYWSTRLRPGRLTQLGSNAVVCRRGADVTYLPDWSGTDLTVRLRTDRAPASVRPVPDTATETSFSWRYPHGPCGAGVPPVSVQLQHTPTRYLATMRVLPELAPHEYVAELLGWSQPLVVVVVAVLLTLLASRVPAGTRPDRRLLVVAVIAVVLAAVPFYGAGYDRRPELVAVLAGLALALLAVVAGRPPRRLASSVLVVIVAAAGIVAVTLDGDALAAGTVATGLAVLLAAALGAVVTARVLTVGAVSTPRPPSVGPLARWGRCTVATLIAAAFGYAIANLPTLDDLSVVLDAEVGTLRYAPAAFLDLLVVAVLLRPLVRRQEVAGWPLAGALFALAVLSRLPSVVVVGVPLPLAEVTLAGVLWAVTRPEPESSAPRTRAAIIEQPRDSVVENARLALQVACALATVPVGYFVITTLTHLPDTLSGTGPQALFTASAALEEALRWLAAGLVFALLMPRIPGRFGPLRAVVVSAAWFAVAGVAHLVDNWSDPRAGRDWTFPGLQLVLFLVVFGVVWDALSLRERTISAAARTLKERYEIERTRTVVLWTIPVLLALIAVGQQVATGTGVDFVKSVLDTGSAIAGG